MYLGTHINFVDSIPGPPNCYLRYSQPCVGQISLFTCKARFLNCQWGPSVWMSLMLTLEPQVQSRETYTTITYVFKDIDRLPSVTKLFTPKSEEKHAFAQAAGHFSLLK